MKAAPPGWRVVYSKHVGAASNYSGYNVVVAPSKTSAWAFGGSNVANGENEVAIAAHWNGRAWAASALPAGVLGEISAASAPSANDVWAVTFFGGLVLHWNGARWTVAKHLGGGGNLTGVVAVSPADVWVFGASGFGPGLGTWHFNGRTWSQWHGYATDVVDGSALSAANIWAVERSLSPVGDIVHYDGTWRPVTASALKGLDFGTISALSATNIWATASAIVDSHTVSYLLHDNGRWTRYPLPAGLIAGQSVVVSDGHGGIWLTAGNNSGQVYFLHRAANGAWSRTLAVGPRPAFADSLAQIAGTSSLFASGYNAAKTGGSALIWADGSV